MTWPGVEPQTFPFLLKSLGIPYVSERNKGVGLLYGQVVRASDLQPEGLGFKSSGRVIPKTLKMEPTAIVLVVPHNGVRENNPVPHN